MRWMWVFVGPEYRNGSGCQLIEDRFICPDCSVAGFDPTSEKFMVEPCGMRWASRRGPMTVITLEIG